MILLKKKMLLHLIANKKGNQKFLKLPLTIFLSAICYLQLENQKGGCHEILSINCVYVDYFFS